jgi:hypothetical protein
MEKTKQTKDRFCYECIPYLLYNYFSSALLERAKGHTASKWQREPQGRAGGVAGDGGSLADLQLRGFAA